MTDTLDRMRDHYRATGLIERLKTAPGAYAAPSAQAWFAGGERVGYHPKARAIVPGRGAPLRARLPQVRFDKPNGGGDFCAPAR